MKTAQFAASGMRRSAVFLKVWLNFLCGILRHPYNLKKSLVIERGVDGTAASPIRI